MLLNHVLDVSSSSSSESKDFSAQRIFFGKKKFCKNDAHHTIAEDMFWSR